MKSIALIQPLYGELFHAKLSQTITAILSKPSVTAAHVTMLTMDKTRSSTAFAQIIFYDCSIWPVYKLCTGPDAQSTTWMVGALKQCLHVC